MPDIAALRFLAVEKDRLRFGPIMNLLRSMGAKHALAAADITTALLALEAEGEPIDIVVADLDANGMDAVALVHGMAKRRHGASLIAATAFPPPTSAGVEVVARGYGLHWLATLQKPLTPRKFREALALRGAREATPVPEFLRATDET